MLEYLSEEQRRDIDLKVDSIHKHWTDLKNLIENRVDLVSIFIQFLEEAESLGNMFDLMERFLKANVDENQLSKLESAWSKIQPAYSQLKNTAVRVVDVTSKV